MGPVHEVFSYDKVETRVYTMGDNEGHTVSLN